ncbi:flagellar motor protein [Myxococcus sp. CA051A]|uniref:flagellar motor protein n=1 Tax=Myxococcus sp. CA051A TaxID=2741739 RepID=UPI00157A7EE2|nr:flagellar motor protein [Myxococcus sp. CA051A]NTX62694.1 flagellar motor protein [Myxococcus sp. CA051A]
MRLPGLLLVSAMLCTGAAWGQGVSMDVPSLASTIAGRVCLDVDGDGRCGVDEPGVAGVRLVLTTGREVRTDSRGRFHLTGVDSRTPDATRGLHLRPGRHRLKVDPRSLPAASRVTPEAATVEVPWGAVALQDFAVRSLASDAPPLELSYSRVPPVADVVAGEGAVRFRLAGQAAVGDRVRVGALDAEVDARGGWSAWVPLIAGDNTLAIQATAPDGRVRLSRQQVDVVRRAEGWLVVPRPLVLVGSFQLPSARDEAAASGVTRLKVEAPAGTSVRGPEGESSVVGPEGRVEVPVTLASGNNRVTLALTPPGGSAHETVVDILAEPRPFAVGLLDLEASFAPADSDFQLRGRGSAHAEVRLGPVDVVGELDLRDTDGRTLRGAELPDWLRPRVPERFDRVADPDFSPEEWGDDSVSLTPNATEARLRVEARHPDFGRAGLGTYRALVQDREVGRYHRPLFGPYAELTTSSEKGPGLRAGVDAFGGSLTDPTRGLSAVPAHEELRATGGSLFYLGAVSVAEGSELVRVEVRDGVTGLPLAERHLVRGRDYDIDYFAGRILLSRPLSFLAGDTFLRTDMLTEAPEPVLVVDYAALRTTGTEDSGGGEVWAEWGGARVGLAAVREGREGRPYTLYSGRGSARLGAYSLEAEAASSRGMAVDSAVFGVSDDGGLSFLRPGAGLATGGEALGLRMRGPGLWGDGSVDASYRWRGRGFSDGAHLDAARFQQLALRLRQPVGRLRLLLLADGRNSADPREPFVDNPFSASTVGASVGWEESTWGVSVEARDARLKAAEVVGQGEALTGGRTSMGVAGRYRLLDGLWLQASHRQKLALHGAGPGRVDDTFSAAGVDVELGRDTRVGVRGGWGPELGPRAWANVESRRGSDVYYGGYSVDVDGPDFGAGRTLTGARTELPDSGTALFVEEVGLHDATSVRLSRAVGLQKSVLDGFSVGARYERGVRSLLDVNPPLRRDAGGVFGQLLLEKLRVEGRFELRREKGTPERGTTEAVDRLQTVVALAAEAELARDVTASGRVDFSRTLNDDALEARLLEGYAALAWRPGPWLVVARYGVTRELLPGTRAAFGDRALQILSLLPAVRLGDRFSVAAGLHAGHSSLEGSSRWVWTGTVRPAVRVVGGLEVAGELARRTASPDGDRLTAVRAEVAYRMDEKLRMAVGYTLLGFSGLGLGSESSEDQDRLYLRAELAY